MGYQKWSYELLHGFCMDAFEKFGFTEQEADIIQDVLLTADLYGIESHGMQRMVRYHKCIEKGMIHVDAKPEIVFETPVSAVVDGHDGMGQLIGHFAMELAIKGMLPHNTLGAKAFTRLHVYAGENHNHAAQQPTVID